MKIKKKSSSHLTHILHVIFEIFENYLVNILLKYLRREMWNSDQVSICHTALWVHRFLFRQFLTLTLTLTVTLTLALTLTLSLTLILTLTLTHCITHLEMSESGCRNSGCRNSGRLPCTLRGFDYVSDSNL